ncbi:MAG: bifunctional phosphopantothenoylcysteine decarboxylase/phosphopantothenate--cysteine ligase CoaBC [Dechloromonas sp.]|jgi:phosphopantothenoylcysteine decarboxylase/phosphopantothenate--cysteine ligase|nr:bifunctional phosphopantothenoylcysteine decarboxylase/phosphopantothenate--cysteine ligase CoaBC [Candidatus Dechloromonas phosphoritropha]MBP8789703.1 bifunctional phosphopantothenoylcysteine decarboxylase/phosphopantothenate--cysteine ligase CoaBC [Azonexus sp.]MBP9229824.1 bifunctional phosphopantothenoylcysteine decarboxylase/phosphopantothenate--cysteine ligase CoaBC [Azonexus sp.]
MELQGKRIVFGVTGGIAAYKAAELLRLLGKQGAEVQVAMTEGAMHFVTATTFQALSGKPVFSDQWDARMPNAMAHIDLSRSADLILVAPASANFLARCANGFADDLLATMVLARNCPLLLAPAMNRQMWENPATQRNVVQLQADGVQFVGPASGEQACGEVGVGRMAEPAEILEEVIALFTPKVLAGKKVLLTAGPTFEAIDSVRGITNLSSGRMGYAVARAARQAGAAVTLVSGPVAFDAPFGVDRIDVRSALDMHAAVLERAAAADIFIAVAAVADYRVANAAEHKLKKDAGGIPPIELIENPDILAAVAALKDGPFCVGFAAESRNLEEYAQAKRQRKGIPLIAGNLIQHGFGGDDNRLVLFDDHGTHPLTPAPKSVLSSQLVQHIADLMEKY